VSRLDGRPIRVKTDIEGRPIAFLLPDGSPEQKIFRRLAYWREWIGVLDGEPERDIWRVETIQGGICEIHCLNPIQAAETWILHGWED
jgi:hypothetical protein